MRHRRGFALLALATAVCLASSPAWAARGARDSGGWAWVDSAEPGVYPVVDVPTSWDTIASPCPDEAVFRIDLSFPFRLYDVTSSTVWLSSNGWLSLRDPLDQAVPVSTPLPDKAVPNALIAFLWDDLVRHAGSFVRHGVAADGDVIEFELRQKGSAGTIVGAIELYRAGGFKLVYETDPELSRITIGIENGAGTRGRQLVRDGKVAPGIEFEAPYAVVFYPTGSGLGCPSATPVLCPAPITDTTAGAPAVIDSYSCALREFTGSERVYRIDQRLPGRFRALLGTGTRRQSLFLVLAGCSPAWECIAGGGTSIDIPSLSPGTYYLVVDGETPADDGPYTVYVVARDGDCNGNGQADGCDITTGRSEDCNKDGRPDECTRCPVDVVFVMDTSGSMQRIADQLCATIDETVVELSKEGIEFRAVVWGITSTFFSCLTDSVLEQLGASVPGPPLPKPGLDVLDHEESWAQATAIVSARFPWTPGAQRMIIPMSDEGPYHGLPVFDPGNDRDTVTQAIGVASAYDVLVSPITPDFALPAVVTLAKDLAAGTGGKWSSSKASGVGVGSAIADLVRSACAGVGGPADAGPDEQLCRGAVLRLDGSRSGVQCPGAREFRWLAAGVEVCGGWSLNPACSVLPTANTRYQLEVRCQDAPGCISFDDMLAEVEGGLPPGLGNTLLGVRSGLDAVFRWAVVPNARTYNLYRHTAKGLWPAVFRAGLPTSVMVPDVPWPPFLYFYRATGVDCGSLEGP